METLITYGVENAYRTITTRDRSGGISVQWIDAAGRTVKTKDPYESITQFEYDANGQLRKQQIFAASHDPTFNTRETRFQYDALGRQRVVITLGSDPDNNKTQWTYDSFDRVLTETNQLNNTKSYAHDSVGREKLLTKADGNQIRYTYDVAAHTDTRGTHHFDVKRGCIAICTGVWHDGQRQLVTYPRRFSKGSFC